MKENKKHEIFIFAHNEDPTELLVLRNLIEEKGIRRVILVNLEYVFELVHNKINVVNVIEGIYLIEKNPRRIPIIFYGGNEKDFFRLMQFYRWHDRKDIGWVENPHEIDKLSYAIEKIEIYSKL